MTTHSRTIGRYALMGPLGPSRRSCLAWDADGHRMVVVTVPRADADPSLFTAAARAAAPVCHPHIAPILAVEDTDSGPLVASEFVRGRSLADLLHSPAPMDPIEILSQTADLCDALSFACERGMLHRPFSPNHAIVDGAGRLVLVGIGGDGGVIADDRESTAPAEVDLVSAVGAVLYELLAVPTRQRSARDGRRPAPLVTWRPDVDPAVAAFVDRWVAQPSFAPLTQYASQLRALIASLLRPSFAVAPIQYDPDSGSALDAFTSEALLIWPDETPSVSDADASTAPAPSALAPTVAAAGADARAIVTAVPVRRHRRRKARRLRTGLAAAVVLAIAAALWALMVR